jgi:hypothetical protein
LEAEEKERWERVLVLVQVSTSEWQLHRRHEVEIFLRFTKLAIPMVIFYYQLHKIG